MPKFNLGDRVIFSRVFLRNTGQFVGSVPFAVGTITDASDKVVGVQWDGDNDNYTRVFDGNLILASRKHLEPA